MNKFCVFLALGLCCLSLVGAEEKEVGDYRLRPGDVIEMTMAGEEDMTKQAVISKEGKVAFPLIGGQKVEGLTTVEVEKKLKALYEKNLFVNASIKVVIKGFAKQWVAVAGAVLNRGEVQLPNNRELTLSEAIAMAGGVLPQGNSRSITVAKRKGGAKQYDLAKSADVKLESGDTVVVPMLKLPRAENMIEREDFIAGHRQNREPVNKAKKLRKVMVTGQINKPGAIDLPEAGKIDVLMAIEQAGGFRAIAHQEIVLLKRKTEDGYETLKIDLRAMRKDPAKLVYLSEGDELQIKKLEYWPKD